MVAGKDALMEHWQYRKERVVIQFDFLTKTGNETLQVAFKRAGAKLSTIKHEGLNNTSTRKVRTLKAGTVHVFSATGPQGKVWCHSEPDAHK